MKFKLFIHSLRQDIVAEKDRIVHDNKGQTLVEFIFLFAILASLSLVLVNSTNARIGSRWKVLVKIITSSDPAKASSKDVNF